MFGGGGKRERGTYVDEFLVAGDVVVMEVNEDLQNSCNLDDGRYGLSLEGRLLLSGDEVDGGSGYRVKSASQQLEKLHVRVREVQRANKAGELELRV